jgi:hypothetical protein
VNSATGAVAALALLALLAVLLMLARVAGRITSPSRRPQPAQPAREFPPPRAHEPGGCWCGELHEGTPARDGEPAWRAS